MIFERHELEFIKELEHELDLWLQINRFEPSKKMDDYGLIRFYRSLVRDFLGIDVSEVREILVRKYQAELTDFFIVGYSSDKLVVFCAFIAHLVMEENLALLFPRMEITGRFFGNWAIGHARDSQFGQLLERRVQHSVGKDGFADVYYMAYLKLSRSDFDSMVRSDTNEYSKPSEDRDAKKLLTALVGASAATIVLTTMAKFARGGFRVWEPTVRDSTQTMFTIGQGPGSVKFYGFCMEKPKPQPRSRSSYRPAYREHLTGQRVLTYDRIPEFIRLFSKFIEIEDEAIVSLAEINDGCKIWSSLQRFFWLITQPYQGSVTKDMDDICKDFTETETPLERQVAYFNVSGLEWTQGAKQERDLDLVLVTKKSLSILTHEGITVHGANADILASLLETLS